MKVAIENGGVITLGMTVRAARMGFAWSHEHGAFVRIEGDGPFKITLHPSGLIANAFNNHGEHRCWWSDADGSPRLDLNRIKPLQGIKRIKRVVQFWINDEGEML